ncbi:MAG: ribosomal protein S18-alanine N-acetyltransferase [Mariprofundus sp.]|nr:ribosomal protein S18-alanine N-acetyltransferase [Mariprofundus sp.]
MLESLYELRAGSSEALCATHNLSKRCFHEPWSFASLYAALEGDYDLLLCEKDGELCGYILSLTIIDEIEIMQIAVHPEYRRQGIARMMSEQLKNLAVGITCIHLEVRLSNQAAHALYEDLGFIQSGYRKQYYAPDSNGLREDALLMTLTI